MHGASGRLDLVASLPRTASRQSGRRRSSPARHRRRAAARCPARVEPPVRSARDVSKLIAQSAVNVRLTRRRRRTAVHVSHRETGVTPLRQEREFCGQRQRRLCTRTDAQRPTCKCKRAKTRRGSRGLCHVSNSPAKTRTWWWARQDSNLQPECYEHSALTIELQAPERLLAMRPATR